MGAAERSPHKGEFYPGLEGLRGYAIFVVFVAHYLITVPIAGYPAFSSIQQLFTGFFFVVPVFFVISGFFINEILLKTRDQENYIKSFYLRRLLRTCPVYYLTLLIVAAVDTAEGSAIDPRFWTNLIFVQNLLPGYLFSQTVPTVSQIGHLWFMAIIMQFYVVWPLVVWLCPDRARLLRVTWTLIALVCAIRVATPYLHLSINDCYVYTFTRADAILLGVALSLSRHSATGQKLQRWSGFAALVTVGALFFIGCWTGTTWPNSYRRIAIIHPLANCAAAFVVLHTMRPNSFLYHLCTPRLVRWIGSLSFAIYIFHFTYSQWFLTSLAPRIATSLPFPLALSIAALAAFILSVGLASLSQTILDRPFKTLAARFDLVAGNTVHDTSSGSDQKPPDTYTGLVVRQHVPSIRLHSSSSTKA